MNRYFDDYYKKYPDLIISILEYFNIKNGGTTNKSVLDFCKTYGDQYDYQPVFICRICKRLWENGVMELLRSPDGWDWNDNYVYICQDEELFQREKQNLKYYFNSVVYGFDYIYETYKDLVIPLVWEKENGDYSVGTGFVFNNGIVTAKHCLTDVTNIQIKGYCASDLESKPVYISENEGVDLAFIETGIQSNRILIPEDGEVMQEVLVMGYPKIPAFTGFLTAEKATISSKASSRITPTKGTITSFGYEYLSKIDAMLITAKIRGGNSGGPVINQHGCLVGVACQLIESNPNCGNYDDLGYGVAIPVKYLMDIIKKKSKCIELPSGFYRDFDDK